ncbi:amidase [Verminephrobacter eiseniae]|uniref:Amidase n=3 Tax=Verminephrobacter eiseniae TaxID=364317 RepID=A1WHU1_VEREI|nr:amidase [Verminephrobacter eiseniae]ABM57198.1 Amidase [Verminephrobacter eiseniae EF01-2]MCW5282826.1 amidase [Verminephrobacter eiseniae]MCW5303142.1 amidase [Verminephrobacter eiseniae]MCW8192346.1 amidase [Verminephrobacter eiseniae]
MLADLTATRERLQSGATTAPAELERCIAAAQAPANHHSFVRTTFDQARSAAAQPGQARLALAGLAVSVKDLFDIAGQTTSAGSTALADAPPAARDCVAVARLRAAGASIIGRSNMTEFACSGVGVNPHFGTPAAWDARSGALPGAPRVPGGSSSGAGVSVATGAAFIGLGSDTGGSIRIPAALNGIVGFKNTARLVPTTGAIPLSHSLDTACALTRSVRDAIVAHEVLAARHVARSQAPLSEYRLALVSTWFLDDMDATVARAFERSIATLRQAGARIAHIAPPAMQAAPAYGFPAPEGYAWHRALLQRTGARYDPRVRARIEKGASMMAWEYIELLQARQHWIERMHAELRDYDALLSPTVPIVAPAIADVAPADGLDAAQDAARDAEFLRVNSLLLRNTSIINLLDGCALSLPCHQPGELPVGLMVWHGALKDDQVLNAALQIEQALQKEARNNT